MVLRGGLCPVQGCGEKVTAADLKNALELRRRIQNQQVNMACICCYTKGQEEGLQFSYFNFHMNLSLCKLTIYIYLMFFLYENWKKILFYSIL